MSQNASDEEMVTLSVRISKSLQDELDSRASTLDFPNRSAFIRAVLEETTEPILTKGAQQGVAEGYADVAAGRTISCETAKEKLGIGENEI